MAEPGTIFSDDEIECFSEDDSEDEKEIERNRISSKNDPFFNDLVMNKFSLNKLLTKPSESSIKKYLVNNSAYEVNDTIERVRQEMKTDESVEDDDDDDDPVAILENETSTEDLEMLKLKNNVKSKEKKKERMEKLIADKMEKEREEFCFEDAPPLESDISFLEMNLSPHILKAIANMGYETPTPIQAATIPIALKGRDICGCAATGTGKTAAFMLPIVQRLIFKPSEEAVTRVLVLVPTRELGVQVYEVAKDICQFTEIVISLSVGGLDRTTQVQELMDVPDVIIATPGRLIDHLHNTPNFSLRDVEVLVLDEADRMLDRWFAEQLNEIIRQCSFTRQTMLFSATMTDQVKDLVIVSLKNPVRVFVNNNTDVAQNLRQEFVSLKQKDEQQRLAVLAYLLINSFKSEVIVFVQQKVECHKMHVIFGLLGLKCGELHSKLKQPKRLEYLEKFKNKEINILFATDVAARGLDIKGVKTVINYTLPFSYEMYVHRVGRTARAGFSGRSITISYDHGEDFKMLRKIQKHSFAPLYERIISKKHIAFYVTKLKNLEPSVEKVLELEREEKMRAGTVSAVDKLKRELVREKYFRKSKKSKIKEIITLEEIEREKERLKQILSRPFMGKEKKEKKDKESLIESVQETAERRKYVSNVEKKTNTNTDTSEANSQKKKKQKRRRKPKGVGVKEVVDNGRKSIFDEDFTNKHTRHVKRKKIS